MMLALRRSECGPESETMSSFCGSVKTKFESETQILTGI